MTIYLETIAKAVESGDDKKVARTVKEALRSGIQAIEVLEKGLIPGVQALGKLFKDGKGINSSFAVHTDSSGLAEEKALAIGFGIGSPYMYETTFAKETLSDLTGERSVLMGGIAGLFKANYDVLREKGHSPSEAFNETVEEALQSLFPMINENPRGLDPLKSDGILSCQLKYFFVGLRGIFRKSEHWMFSRGR